MATEIAFAYLKAGGTPVDKLNGALRFDGGDSGIHVFGDHVSTVQQAARHVLALSRITFHLKMKWDR